MPEETRQAQRLEPILCVGIDQLWVARQQTDNMIDLAGRCRFEDREYDRFICEEGCNHRLMMIGGDEDRAKTIFADMNQTWVHDELAFHLMPVPLFDRVKKAKAHSITVLPSL